MTINWAKLKIACAQDFGIFAYLLVFIMADNFLPPEYSHINLNYGLVMPSGPTLVSTMAYCLMAPSHYLNQCWPKRFCGIHLTAISQEMPMIFILHIILKITHFKITAASPMGQWIKSRWHKRKMTVISKTWLLAWPLVYIMWDPVDDKSTLDQLITWCHHAKSHNLSQHHHRPSKAFDGLVQDCSNSSTLTMEFLQVLGWAMDMLSLGLLIMASHVIWCHSTVLLLVILLLPV